ncbi:MAG: hypothetical protein ACI9X4_001011 [Glaciecola sp.]
MYGRQVGDHLLSFGHEGVLYNKSFVMYDRETDSLWVHTTGASIKGELRGAALEFLPSEVVPWSVWRERHPDTLVLDRGGESEGFMGTFEMADQPSEFGASVGGGAAPVLYPLEALQAAGVINDGGRVVLYLKDSATLRSFMSEGRSYQLLGSGRLSDGGSNTWDPASGKILSGGADDLTRIVSTAWRLERWDGFYPDGEVFGE